MKKKIFQFIFLKKIKEEDKELLSIIINIEKEEEIFFFYVI